MDIHRSRWRSDCLSRHSCGFTIIELMIAIAIMSILLSIALPNLQQMVASQRVQSTNSDMVAALLFARSEAIKRNVSVEVAPSVTGWSGGWTVKIGSTVLQTQNALHDSLVVEEKDSGGISSTTSVTFGGNGRPLAGSAGTSFTVASSTFATIPQRCITLGLAGLPETRRDTDGDRSNGCQ